ncbi:hypothetical protein [Glutamicibacter ardleyensis]|uniref:Uncharacterized protein n=1 Tax=Glutamicibacter ardleyensis TaxID=225894 RepID=A0ABQ2DFK4_9MICC|nr:hypothetical protein [Glutamicibacter ardleyensis]GGJ56007.1 hypothetical protein GCM10007173_13550 [Glutamicibacter ardleyensis]
MRFSRGSEEYFVTVPLPEPTPFTAKVLQEWLERMNTQLATAVGIEQIAETMRQTGTAPQPKAGNTTIKYPTSTPTWGRRKP